MHSKKIIAMWSGPRNLSTSLMYSFQNRGDTQISDEPFYGYFLSRNNIIHPNRDTIIQAMETNKKKIVNYLSNVNNLHNNNIWYQKQMTQHIVMSDQILWIKHINNCFLIRDPLDVIISYKKIYNNVSLDLIGLKQQYKIFNFVINNIEQNPPVIDAKDLRDKPKNILTKLCDKLDIDFTSKMLNWPKGPKKDEGIWAQFWYQNVWQTTSFIKGNQKKIKKIPSEILDLYNEAKILYDKLYKYKINV